MIYISNKAQKTVDNFWNHALFHPSDAVEDPWGKRILDRFSNDGSVKMLRIYAMFEDIVYLDEEDKLCFDFRLSDLRLDYLVEKGFDLLIAYAGIPEAVSGAGVKTGSTKNKTRYKGKMWNTVPPKDYALWEQVCYEYTKHIVDRYGIDVVSRWRIQCLNEPDHFPYFLGDIPRSEEGARIRCAEFCKMFRAFEKGVRRVSDAIHIGGPALAGWKIFFTEFLKYVKKNDLKLDYIAIHNYGTSPRRINEGDWISADKQVAKFQMFADLAEQAGFHGIEMIVDEWGASSSGFMNKEECPALMFRETEVYASFYVQLVSKMLQLEQPPSKMMLCLSGQHEMTEDFSGFRNFFTLNFIAKPIYNAFVMASKLGSQLVGAECSEDNISIIPTRSGDGYAVLLSYSASDFREDLPEITETVVFPETYRAVTVWCIDQENTNPYRYFQKHNMQDLSADDIGRLRDEGKLKPMQALNDVDKIDLRLTPNTVYLICTE